MVDLFQTDLGIITKNAKILNEVSAWINSFDIQIKNEIIYLIQYEQLVSKGIDAKGKVIGLYKPFTEQLNPLKKAGEHYTLLDTGEFFKSMFIDVMRDSIIINGNGQKDNENLFIKFGDDIVGLTDENKEKLADLLLEKYINYVREILQVD